MKSIVITGSSRGIGFAMGMAFLREGCQVTFSGRSKELSAQNSALLKPYAGKYIFVPCDVKDKESIKSLWALSVKRWGEVDIWINNAGQNTPHVYSWETDKEYTDSVIKTNLLGMIYGSQIAASEMQKQGKGAIYSMEGLGSNRMIQVKTVLYGTTKHALTYFMKGLAKELEGTGVIAGRLSPGMMVTEFITKMPAEGSAELFQNPQFKRVFNALADRPETVAKFFIPRILKNNRNNVEITWLTNHKAAFRFVISSFRKDQWIEEV